jgi:hypothetical protein
MNWMGRSGALGTGKTAPAQEGIKEIARSAMRVRRKRTLRMAFLLSEYGGQARFRAGRGPSISPALRLRAMEGYLFRPSSSENQLFEE